MANLMIFCFLFVLFFFFFNDTATTEIYTLSLHDALPIYELVDAMNQRVLQAILDRCLAPGKILCLLLGAVLLELASFF